MNKSDKIKEVGKWIAEGLTAEEVTKKAMEVFELSSATATKYVEEAGGNPAVTKAPETAPTDDYESPADIVAYMAYQEAAINGGRYAFLEVERPEHDVATGKKLSRPIIQTLNKTELTQFIGMKKDELGMKETFGFVVKKVWHVPSDWNMKVQLG